MQFFARRYDTNEPFEYEIKDDRIVAAAPVSGDQPAGLLPWIAPSLVDLQVNGYAGREFSSPGLTVDDVRAVAAVQYAQGVGRFCPTVTTAPFAVLDHGLATIAAACRADRSVAERIPGIHLEGPYISAVDGPRGAHPAAFCKPPDWDEFQRLQQSAEGRIRLITLSPEYPQAPDFIRRAVTQGVVVSIGHTAADTQQIRAAINVGARLSTHLGNGAHRTLRRHPNYLWDQLADDRLTAMLIVDGHHLPPEVVQTFVRAKTPERIILVSDVSAFAGLPAGRYGSQLCELEILADGRIMLAEQNQLMAGASRPLVAGIANIMQFAAVGLRAAVDMASHHPAKMLGIDVCGLRAGDRADFILLHAPGGEFARGFTVTTPRDLTDMNRGLSASLR